MNSKFVFQKTVLAASIAMLTACGGGGSGTADNSGTTVGTITGFGSVYINGVEYETDSASISIDGVSSPETDLGVGDVCVLHGTVNADGLTGTATAVICTDELEGFVADVSGLGVDGTGTINVMGQTVTVTMDTMFDSYTLASINDLSVNDIVEVSGYSDGSGNILATRIETKTTIDYVELKGIVSGLDTSAMTFVIGGLTIYYGAAIEVPGNLANDLYVEVKSNDASLGGNLVDGFTLNASKVEVEEDGDIDIDGDENDDIEVQGMVTDITPTSFKFNGQLVEFDSIEIDDDFDLNSMYEGMVITVEGYIDANNNFVIEEIEEDQHSELEVKGFVTGTTETTITIDVGGTPMTFIVNNDTRSIDEQDEGVTPLHYFSLADVADGDYVEIEYYVDDVTGDNIATELEREDAPSI